MTQNDKDLLLRDLCARLPYGVKVQIPDKYGGHTSVIKNIDIDGYVVDDEGNLTEIEWARPYLFPLSSMTEEQKKELKVICDWRDDEKDAQSILVLYYNHCVMKSDVTDWFHKNHFDYRGLIPMGLANNATGLNIY